MSRLRRWWRRRFTASAGRAARSGRRRLLSRDRRRERDRDE
jgi:hypothetical protein